jgi:hypothetical protein
MSSPSGGETAARTRSRASASMIRCSTNSRTSPSQRCKASSALSWMPVFALASGLRINISHRWTMEVSEPENESRFNQDDRTQSFAVVVARFHTQNAITERLTQERLRRLTWPYVVSEQPLERKSSSLGTDRGRERLFRAWGPECVQPRGGFHRDQQPPRRPRRRRDYSPSGPGCLLRASR